MLMALLGEMTIVQGNLVMAKNPSNVDENGLMHSMSYAAQTPWLRHQSIKGSFELHLYSYLSLLTNFNRKYSVWLSL